MDGPGRGTGRVLLSCHAVAMYERRCPYVRCLGNGHLPNQHGPSARPPTVLLPGHPCLCFLEEPLDFDFEGVCRTL
jgi:hypothetical protein